MASNKYLTKEEMLEALIDNIGSWDEDTLISIAQNAMLQEWSRMTNISIEHEYNCNITGSNDEDDGHYIKMLETTKAGKILFGGKNE